MYSCVMSTLNIDDHLFSKMIDEAMAQLPQKYIENLDNVAITYEDDPSAEQRKKLELRCHQTLFGLYEGIPRTKRGIGYNLVIPDRITIFKNPILQASSSIEDVKRQVKHTLWHEIAHHYGLDHDRIHELERKHL